jgi:hypothetical protein
MVKSGYTSLRFLRTSLVFSSFLLCFTLTVNAASAPEIVKLTVDSTSIDVSQEQQTVKVEVSLKDENGLVSANLLFNHAEFALFHYSQSHDEWTFDAVTQRYNSTFTFVFEASHAAGNWELIVINSTVDPSDNETHTYYSSQELVALGFEPNVEVINTNEVDTTAPVLVTLAMSELSVDVTSGKQIIVVNAALKDVNAIANGSFWFSNPQMGLQLIPTTSSNWVFNNETQHFEASFSFDFEPKHMAGNWELTSTGYISDVFNNQNFGYDSAEELLSLGFSSILEVQNSNAIDTTAPELVSFEVTPLDIDISTEVKVVDITVSIKEDNVIANAPLWLRHSEANDVLHSTTNTEWVFNQSTGNYDATFTFEFAQNQIRGKWQASFISDISDSLQNKSYLYDTPKELMDLGFNPDVDVISSFGLDYVAPILHSLSISPQGIDVSSAEQAVIVTVTLKDDLAIGNAEFWFRRAEFGLQLYPTTSTDWIHDSNDDLYRATFTYVFDTNKVAGIWEFSAIGGISDERGNISYDYDSSTEIIALGFSSTLAVTNTNIVDTEAPKLTNITISPTIIDVSSQAQIVTVQASFQDKNGIGNAQLAFRHSGIGSFEEAQSSTEWQYNDTTDTYDATFSFVFDEEHISRDWQVMTINPVTDKLGNRAYDYDSATELIEQGFDITLDLFNSNKFDDSAPKLVALTLSKESVDVTLDEDIVIVDLSIKDENGIGKADFAFFRPEFNYILKPISSSPWLYNRELGTFDQRLTFVFDKTLVAGNWEFSSINGISDAKGTMTDNYNNAAKLLLAGFQPHLFLINSNFVDTSAPVISTIAMSPRIIDTTLGNKSINVTVSLKDDTGIGQANFGFSSPDNNVLKLPNVKTVWVYDSIAKHYQSTLTYEFDSTSEDGTWSLFSLNSISDDLPEDSNNSTYMYDSVDKIQEFNIINEIVVINSTPKDNQPPKLVSLMFEQQEIDVSSGITTVAAKASMQDDSGIANAEFWLYQPDLGKYLQANTSSDWLLNPTTKEYEASFNFIFDDNTGIGNWQLLAKGAVSDVLGHSTEAYNAIDNLLALNLSPFLSVNDGFVDNKFDSKTNTIYDYGGIAQLQTNKFSLTIEEAQNYELWIFANKETQLTDVIFTGAAGIEKNCVAAANKLRCQFIANEIDNIENGIIANVKSSALDKTNLTIRAFLNPDSDQIEINWLNNTSSFPEIDIDGDGINNNLDTDDDGDGIIDTLDSHPFDASENKDFDGDAIGDIADTDDDNDGVVDELDIFPFDPKEAIDTDIDGIGNNADKDDDGDGILDTLDTAPLDSTIGDNEAPIFAIINDVTIEATGQLTTVNLVAPSVTDNNLNPPTITSNASANMAVRTHEVIWTATDYVGNISTATQLVKIQDTQGPVFDNQETLTLSARGFITRVTSDIEIFATDTVDGEILSIFAEADLKSGSHIAPISAKDSAGNITHSELIINIDPLVLLGTDVNVGSGAIYSVPIKLSGLSATYPVSITYKVTGQSQRTISISEQQSIDIKVSIPSSTAVGDKLSFELVAVNNAVITNDNKVNFIVTNNNLSPSVKMLVEQSNVRTTIIDSSEGIVTATAQISDSNQADRHAISWEVSDVLMVDLATDNKENTFEFTPEELAPGIYVLNAVVTESNTSESHQILASTTLTLVNSLNRLSSVNDSDKDGVFDAVEGFGDNDQDGIPNYLDNDSDPTRLPIKDSVQPLQTAIGLQLTLGDIVRSSNGTTSGNASISAFDLAEQIPNGEADNSKDAGYSAISDIVSFNVSGLAFAGDSVPIVFPLSAGDIISDTSVYRKYSQDKGWFNFAVDSKNSISTAAKNSDGNCPEPSSTQFTVGLNVGDNCILLTIEDGGNNDADGLANGIVKDPGVLAESVVSEAPTINIANTFNVNEEQELIIDASNTSDINKDELTYLWEKVSGVDVTLSSTTGSIVTLKAPQVSSDQLAEIKLTVSNGKLSSVTLITVNISNISGTADDPKTTDEGGGVLYWLLMMGLLIIFQRQIMNANLR